MLAEHEYLIPASDVTLNPTSDQETLAKAFGAFLDPLTKTWFLPAGVPLNPQAPGFAELKAILTLPADLASWNGPAGLWEPEKAATLASQGDRMAAYTQGVMAFHGLGMGLDKIKAEEWFKKALAPGEKSVSSGWYGLALCRFFAEIDYHGQNDDAKKAFYYAALLGHSVAREAFAAITGFETAPRMRHMPCGFRNCLRKIKTPWFLFDESQEGHCKISFIGRNKCGMVESRIFPESVRRILKDGGFEWYARDGQWFREAGKAGPTADMTLDILKEALGEIQKAEEARRDEVKAKAKAFAAKDPDYAFLWGADGGEAADFMKLVVYRNALAGKNLVCPVMASKNPTPDLPCKAVCDFDGRMDASHLTVADRCVADAKFRLACWLKLFKQPTGTAEGEAANCPRCPFQTSDRFKIAKKPLKAECGICPRSKGRDFVPDDDFDQDAFVMGCWKECYEKTGERCPL